MYPEVNDSVEMRLLHGQFGPKLAFIFRPGSNPANLQLGFEGQDSLNVDVFGFLRMYVRGRWIAMREAIAYQMNGNAIVPVSWIPEYITSEGSSVVHFHFDTYNETLPLILLIGAPPMPPAPANADPRNMNWSTYAGGNEGDELVAVDSDASGDVYTCGYTADINFPVSTGYQVFPAFQADFVGTHESVVMKFDHTNKRILWATFLGGAEGVEVNVNEGLDQALDLAVYKGTNDSMNYVFVTGSTGCNDFLTPNNPNSPFANAVHEPWLSPSSSLNAAYLGAFSQDQGRYHWGTTIGAGIDGYWEAEGLGVDVDNDGRVAWVGRLIQVTPEEFDFNPVVPVGAYAPLLGGSFLAWFDANYQYEWKIPFGSQCYFGCGAYDVKLRKTGGISNAYVVGTAIAYPLAYSYTLDTYAPPGFTGFIQHAFGGGYMDAYFSNFNLSTHQNAFCTRWGGNENELGTALAVFGKTVLVAGGTQSDDLSSAHLPGTGGMHDAALNGPSDGFLLEFDLEPGVPTLEFGTLVGSDGREEIFDVEVEDGCTGGPCDFYITGESTSTSGLLSPDNSALFQQSVLGNDGEDLARDGFFLRSNTANYENVWSSYVGGGATDRSWGAASTADELYVVGGTISNQDHFPLKEFNTNAPEDWYDGDIYNNLGGGSSFYSYNNTWFGVFFLDLASDPGLPPWTHDGYITSFTIPLNIGVKETNAQVQALPATLLDPNGLWALRIPSAGDLVVVDATGKFVLELSVRGTFAAVDLRALASGLYSVHFRGHDGTHANNKLLRP